MLPDLREEGRILVGLGPEDGSPRGQVGKTLHISKDGRDNILSRSRLNQFLTHRLATSSFLNIKKPLMQLMQTGCGFIKNTRKALVLYIYTQDCGGHFGFTTLTHYDVGFPNYAISFSFTPQGLSIMLPIMLMPNQVST